MLSRGVRATAVFLFAVCLFISALLSRAGAFPPELAALNDAMLALNRTDSIEYTYRCNVFSQDSFESIWINVLYDRLSGAFAADYYERDEDGTRRVMRDVFAPDCGTFSSLGDTEPPYIDLLSYLSFDLADILDIYSYDDGDNTAICITLDPSVNLKEPNVDTSALIVNDIKITYVIDPDNVLCGESAIIDIMSDQDGAVTVDVSVSVIDRDLDDILSRIRSL